MPNHYSKIVQLPPVVPLMPGKSGVSGRCVKDEDAFGCGCLALLLLTVVWVVGFVQLVRMCLD